MHSGKGSLILRDGRSLPVSFQFSNDFGDTRGGYLLCNTADLDPAALLGLLKVECEDGRDLMVAVMHSSDRYLAVTGRILSSAA
ncbi:MAG: hypothetical protein EOP23_02765 [Hyphomicrobiales bacterium]|nr:MAG: hypothetical protein EOP23_02765 [Hyphomicrobiales bacterium]